MRNRTLYLMALLITFTSIASSLMAQDNLKYAELGDFQLDNHKVILQCRIGYRTFGRLDENKSNSVLFPTWFGGTSRNLIGYLGKDQLVDSTKYFVILVDALGNGVSSSPSNSKIQPHDSFPEFSTKDMVSTQFKLLEQELKIKHLHAVIGISMGANQALQWMVQYPTFIDKIIAIAGTTKPTPYDMLIYRAFVLALETGREAQDWKRDAMRRVGSIHALLLQTPASVAGQSTEAYEQFYKGFESYTLSKDPYDYLYQIKAVSEHNIFENFDGSFENAIGVIKAKLLVINDANDHLVFPDPAIILAKAINGETFLVEKNCGHYSFFGNRCDKDTVNHLVSKFLEE